MSGEKEKWYVQEVFWVQNGEKRIWRKLQRTAIKCLLLLLGANHKEIEYYDDGYNHQDVHESGIVTGLKKNH